MRALFICPNLTIGGAERHWATLLPALRARGIDVRLLTLDGKGFYFDALVSAGVPCASAGMRSRYDLVGIARVFSAVRPRPDVVVSRSFSAFVLGHAVARLARARHVSNEHVAYNLRPLRRTQDFATRLIAKHVALAISVSTAAVASLLELGFDQDRILVIPNGIDGDAFRRSRSRDRAATREALGFSEKEFLALIVARLRPEKRVEDFVRAVKIASAVDTRVRGLVVGDGPCSAGVGASARETGGIVRVLGQRHDVADLMEAADVLCLTSAAEAEPMVILEAMASALPFVVTDVGGVGSMVCSSKSGVVVPVEDPHAFADALIRLSADKDIRDRMGAAGLAWQRDNASLEAMADRYALALRAVVGDSKRRR